MRTVDRLRPAEGDCGFLDKEPLEESGRELVSTLAGRDFQATRKIHYILLGGSC